VYNTGGFLKIILKSRSEVFKEKGCLISIITPGGAVVQLKQKTSIKKRGEIS